MSSRRRTEDQQIYRDRLLAAGQMLDTIRVFDGMNQQGIQNQLEQEKLRLAQAETDRRAREEARDVRKLTDRQLIAGEMSDFMAVFDATNMEHQKGLAAWETKARTSGFDDREVENMLLPAKRSLVALNDQLAVLRKDSGISDWERYTDDTGVERIDVSGTLRKHSGMMKDLAQVQSSWEPGGREEQLVDYWTSKDPNITRAQAVRAANKNQRVGSEYSSLVEQGLFAPSQDFLNDFRRQPTKPGVTLAEESIGFVPTMFNSELFDTHPGALKARANLRRVQNGEVPVFKKDPASGTTMYDNDGAAVIESWQPSYDSRTKAAQATKAEAEATNANMLNTPTQPRDPITGLPVPGAAQGPSLAQQQAEADIALDQERAAASKADRVAGKSAAVIPVDGD